MVTCLSLSNFAACLIKNVRNGQIKDYSTYETKESVVFSKILIDKFSSHVSKTPTGLCTNSVL